MNDKMITGVIENMDTGEKTEFEEYFFIPNYELTAIVLVKGIKSNGPHEDGTIEIYVKCKALDGLGMVYDLDIYFCLHTFEEKAVILSDFTEDSVHLVWGLYGIILDEKSIILYPSDYHSVEPDYEEDAVREAFRINSKKARV
jgi:hypothetical protein